jgi:hypothetical protein
MARRIQKTAMPSTMNLVVTAERMRSAGGNAKPPTTPDFVGTVVGVCLDF